MSEQGPASRDVKQQTAQERRLMGLSAFDRHQWLMKDAIKYYRAKLPPEQQTVKTDFDVLKEQYRFAACAKCCGQALQLLMYMPYKRHCSLATVVHMLLHTVCVTSCNTGGAQEYP